MHISGILTYYILKFCFAT